MHGAAFPHIVTTIRRRRMRCLAVILVLCSDIAAASEWQSASTLTGTHTASASERAALVTQLARSQVVYNFEGDSRVLIHDGDLRIDGNLASGELLVVRGNLTVTGMYDDDRDDGIGVLVVLGDMHVRDVYSWGAMHVSGDLTASGLLMTVYNDFTFEVGGKLDARALLVSDKSTDYTAGTVGVAWTDERRDTDIAAGLRTLEPSLFTHAGHMELDEDSDVHSLDIDSELARDRLASGEQVFRANPGDASLPHWAQAAIAAATPAETLDGLIGKDPLIDQLIAARPALPPPLAKRLVAGGDPVVLAWLAQTSPQLVLAAGAQAMTPDAAAAVVAQAQTSEDELLRIATHADPRVRIALAGRDELSTALINRLAADTDASVRAAVIAAQYNALELEPAVLTARLRDDAPAVKDALVGARLDTSQALALLPQLSEHGRRDFARLLREQARGARPTALDTAGIVAVADAILARKQADAATDAFMSLPPPLQRDRFDALAAARVLDLAAILETSADADLLQRIVAMADKAGAPLPYQLARNPNLPDAMQLDLVARAAKSRPDPDDDSMDAPDDLLSELLGNDAATDAAVLAATDLALARGLAPDDGGMQNALFHHRNLPPQAIERLDAALGNSEDWALQLLLQRRATPAQLDRALRRWYDDRRELLDELRRIQAKGGDYFTALANAKHTELREVAAWNIATPLPALLALVDDAEQGVAWTASGHPALPAQARMQLVPRADVDAYPNVGLDAARWTELATSLPTRAQRMAALAQAATAREREAANAPRRADAN